MRAVVVVMVAVSVLVACSSDDRPSAQSPPASSAAAPTGRAPVDNDPGDFTAVSLNLLHGLNCPRESDHCNAPGRVDLMVRLVEEVRCPDVVALQEISTWMYDLVAAKAPSMCGGTYHIVWVEPKGIDKELVLTTLPVVAGPERAALPVGLRAALWVRLQTAAGPADVVVTHTGASASNMEEGGLACSPTSCPPPCDSAKPAITCQVLMALELLRSKQTGDALGVLMGDLNIVPAAPSYGTLIGSGLVDTYLAAGNPECEPASGVGCTGGRGDTTLAALSDPAAKEEDRIDYLFLNPGPRCRPAYGTGDDADGDGLATGLFAHEPTVDGPSGLVWPSDHVGTALDLSCTP